MDSTQGVSSLDNVILIVDDDPQIRSVLKRYLTRHEFEVREASSGQEMRVEIATVPPTVVLLDLGLPDTDGLTLLAELRRQADLGIIIVSGMSDQVDRIVGLEMGADDYVSKPIDQRELLARIRSVRRRVQAIRATTAEIADNEPEASVLHFSGWHLDTLARSLTSPTGEYIALTTMEFDTLLTLANGPGVVMNREQLLQVAARRDWEPFDRAIDAVIVKLRRKLGEDPRDPQLIKTVRGIGYVFSSKVTNQRLI